MIPYGCQEITQDDIDNVIQVLKSDLITQGPKIDEFERLLEVKLGAEYAVAMNSATSALHAACLALGLGPDDEMWTSPNSFVASANCGLFCGAKVDFVDIDPVTLNMCPVELERRLKFANKANKLPKVIVFVDFSGSSAGIEDVHNVAKSYGVNIIEDASHAIGGKYKNRYVGNCLYSDITVFSFHPVKIITTGEGGVAMTKSKILNEKLQLFRSHGVTRKTELFEGKNLEPWYYEQIALGLNYRLTDIQAALGCSQLKKLDTFVNKRNRIADQYNQAFQNLPISLPIDCEHVLSSRHLYTIQLDSDAQLKSRLDVFNELRNRGIGVNVHYIPIHTQPYYRKLGFRWGDFPNSESYYSKTISIPMFSSLTDEKVEFVIQAVKETILI